MFIIGLLLLSIAAWLCVPMISIIVDASIWVMTNHHIWFDGNSDKVFLSLIFVILSLPITFAGLHIIAWDSKHD